MMSFVNDLKALLAQYAATISRDVWDENDEECNDYIKARIDGPDGETAVLVRASYVEAEDL
jgi:hypothetical protein